MAQIGAGTVWIRLVLVLCGSDWCWYCVDVDQISTGTMWLRLVLVLCGSDWYLVLCELDLFLYHVAKIRKIQY